VIVIGGPSRFFIYEGIAWPNVLFNIIYRYQTDAGEFLFQCIEE
jgi:hypothetical protein